MEAGKRGLSPMDVAVVPEQDSWIFQNNPGVPDGPSMVCDVLVMRVGWIVLTYLTSDLEGRRHFWRYHKSNSSNRVYGTSLPLYSLTSSELGCVHSQNIWPELSTSPTMRWSRPRQPVLPTTREIQNVSAGIQHFHAIPAHERKMPHQTSEVH